MSRTVASSDCLFRFVGGRRSMPLEIACGLHLGINEMTTDRVRQQNAPNNSHRPPEVTWVVAQGFEQGRTRCSGQCLRVLGTQVSSIIQKQHITYKQSVYQQIQVLPAPPDMTLDNTRFHTQGGQELDRDQPRPRPGCKGLAQLVSVSDKCRTR